MPNAEEHLIKAQLVYKISRIMKHRRLTQVEAARIFGVKQPDVSKMLRGDFRQFSAERLLNFLVALGHDVEIVVKPHRGRGGSPRSFVSLEFLFEQNVRQTLAISHCGYVLSKGRVVVGTPAEIADRPEVREAYLG